jgi:hypothetical protein
MLHNKDVDMLLFTYINDPNIIKSINKESYTIYMDNYYWYLCIMRINNKIIIPMKYKYCYKNFYFKINTQDKYVKYICKHKDKNIHLAYKYLYINNNIEGRDITNYLKYHFNECESKNKQVKVYHNTKIFKCVLQNSSMLKDFNTFSIIVKVKCHEFTEQLDKNNTKELKLLNIIEQIKIVYGLNY